MEVESNANSLLKEGKALARSKSEVWRRKIYDVTNVHCTHLPKKYDWLNGQTDRVTGTAIHKGLIAAKSYHK